MNQLHLPKDDVHGPRLPILLHYNLITDPHMEIFRRGIESIVKDGMEILELGSGSGILSMFAARAGGRITAVDSDPQLTEYSKIIAQNNGLGDRINFICDDAETFTPDRKFDLIICEMQDTACMREKQISVMNRMINYLTDGGRTFASGITNMISLTRVNYDFFGLNIPLPFFDTAEVPSPETIMSEKKEFGKISFSEYNREDVSFSFELTISDDGVINSFMIETLTHLTTNLDCPGSDWFNAPYVVPLGRDFEVNRGDICHLEISYTMGEGLKSFSYKFSR